METAFAPLLDPGKLDDPSFVNKPQDITTALSQGQQKQQQPINPVIPNALNPQSMEEKLKAEGSGTSTLSMILAIAGAAKGDFRGLQAIEESKRRTSLAKSMIPEITKANKMVNEGKWEEASSYVNDIASSYGMRADYLVPYFQQMQASIQKKQEGWNNLKFLAKSMEGRVPEGHPNYPVYQALKQAVIDRDQPSETILSNWMTRYASPHTQITGNRMTQQSLLTGESQTQTIPEAYSAKDFDTFTGLKTAAVAGVTKEGLTDLFNGKTVKRQDGTVLEPDSREAALIKAHYINQQPTEARLKIMQNLKIESPLLAQLVAQGVPTENIALGEFGKGGSEMQNALTGQEERMYRQTVRTREGILEVEPVQGPVLDLDPQSPGYLSEITRPVTSREITQSGGKLGKPQPETVSMIRKTQAAIQGLDTATELLNQGTTLQTRGDKIAQGLLQKFSNLPYIGYPVGEKTEARQLIKSVLNTAIEQIENTALAAPGQIRGGDRTDIAQLKAFASGDFKSEKEVLSAIERTRQRLSNMTNMLISQPGATTKPKTPASVIAPLIPPKDSSTITIPPAMIEAEKIAREKQKESKSGGAITVTVPVDKGTPAVSSEEKEKAAIKENLKQQLNQRRR